MNAGAQPLTLLQVAHAVGGDDALSDSGAADAVVTGGCIDARRARPGTIFVALPGATTHGARHAEQAAAGGAIGMLVGREVPAATVEAAAAHLPVVRARAGAVEALGEFARLWRRHCGFSVVGITGSSGKTSTKDILASLLRRTHVTVASFANHNNEIGVPETMLGAPADTQVVVCEMGMRGLGQIEYLCQIVEPDVGLVTNAGTAHIGLLGSVDAIVRAKAEMVAGTLPDGTAVVPVEQPELLTSAAHVPRHTLLFGEGEQADCAVSALRRVEGGIEGIVRWQGSEHPFSLPLHGLHQGRNLAAALCALAAVGGDVGDALANVGEIGLSAGRGDRFALAGGGVLVDDAYNANPDSFRAALADLEALPAARRVAVVGSMTELGESGERLHREVARALARSGAEAIVVVRSPGDEARWMVEELRSLGVIPHVVDGAESAAALAVFAYRPGDAVLVKASNAVGLSQVADAIRERHGVGALVEAEVTT